MNEDVLRWCGYSPVLYIYLCQWVTDDEAVGLAHSLRYDRGSRLEDIARTVVFGDVV